MKVCQYYNLGLYFSAVSNDFAQRPALRYGEIVYTYDELYSLSNQLAQFLVNQGCSKGDVIAIASNKTVLSYAMMLASIRIGVVYVNLDSTSPEDRLQNILQVSGASFLFYDQSSDSLPIKNLPESGKLRQIYLHETILPVLHSTDLAMLDLLTRDVDGSCLAYIMFTSGSTGMPKGVAVTHQNVLHFINWGIERFNITEQDNFANLSPMYFDNSVFDFYVGLFSGASLTPIKRELLTKPYELVNYVNFSKCSIWFSVPSLLIYLMAMKALSDKSMTSLRAIVFGGEGYPKNELKKLYDIFHNQASLVNVYGPTECTCICSAYTIGDHDFHEMDGLPTLGCLNQNFDYRVLDELDNDSTVGELCLIGPLVAAGYFNDPNRTAVSFFTLLDSNRYMKRMYRTGDIVRVSENKLYFVGRKDNQVKHLGYRIELEEVEHAFLRLPQISQAVVIHHRTNTAFGKLVAFLASDDSIDEKTALIGVSKLLPDYMIPSKIVLMPILPKNPNGKVDRLHLRSLLE